MCGIDRDPVPESGYLGPSVKAIFEAPCDDYNNDHDDHDDVVVAPSTTAIYPFCRLTKSRYRLSLDFVEDMVYLSAG